MGSLATLRMTQGSDRRVRRAVLATAFFLLLAGGGSGKSDTRTEFKRIRNMSPISTREFFRPAQDNTGIIPPHPPLEKGGTAAPQVRLTGNLGTRTEIKKNKSDSFGTHEIATPQERLAMTGNTANFSITEPYPLLSGGGFTGPPVPESPDPLVSYRWPSTAAADGLQIYFLRPVAVATDMPGSFENVASLTSDSPAVTINGTGSIRVDFGVESAAWLEMESDDLAGDVEMSISEYNQPAVVNVGPENPVKRKKPVRYGSVYRLELNRELYEGVRFGWIHVVSFSQPWHLKGIRAVCQVKPANYNGSFRASDPLLTRIWYTGAYTVKLNLLKDYFGAILMDRGDRYSWTGDAYPAQAAALAAFGNYDFVRANLERTADDDNGTESYALYWILSLVDYYWFTGDGTTLGRYIAAAEKKLAHADSVCESSREDLVFFGWDERLGAGYEDPNTFENRSAFRMLYIRACREFGLAMEHYGRPDLRAEYAGRAEAKTARLRSDPDWTEVFGLHDGAEALNAGFTDSVEKAALYERNFRDSRRRVSYSPFNQSFIIRALGELGRTDLALDTIKEYWGGMLAYGGTTFFEVFRPDWNDELGPNDPVPNNQCGYTSLAHPWGSGVTRWLTDEVLGVKPTKPGFETFDVLPHLGGRLTSVSGTVPTTRGLIEAAFDIAKGRSRVVVPAGASGRVGIPKEGKSIRMAWVNGNVLYDGIFHRLAGIGRGYQDDEYIYIEEAEPGAYDIAVIYSGATPQTFTESLPYAAKFLGADSSTQGNWKGTYGKDGYILCNYAEGEGDAASHLTSLPVYIRSVEFKKNGTTLWTQTTEDARTLQPPGGNAGARRAACINTLDPVATYQTMTVDIEAYAAPAPPYRIALYFVDWDDRGRTSAVEMFDLNTKNLVSLLKIVSDYRGGKYLIYSYHDSCRFRINQVRGPNAVLSGVFFDSEPQAPTISLSRRNLLFLSVEDEIPSLRQSITVQNGGTGGLSWTAFSSPNWLKVEPDSGGQDEDMQVWVDPAGLKKGTYKGEITVAAGGVRNSPQRIAVELRIIR